MLAFITSFLIVYLSLPFVIKLFYKLNLVESRTKKSQQEKNYTATSPVPRGAGISLFLGIFVACLIFLPFDKHLIGIFLAALFILIIGVWDDIVDISPILRLVSNIISALIVVASGIGIAYLSNPFGGVIDLSFLQYTFSLFGTTHSIWILSDILAIVWITWCLNIVGWSSGVDGQLPGFVSISAFFISLLALKFSSDVTQWPVFILGMTVSGAYLGFLPYNFYPQKIMPGYSGKSLAGFFLAILSILSGAKLATLFFLIGIPMLDAVVVIIGRIINKKSPFSSSNTHLHHILLSRGWGRRRIAIFYWTLTLIMGIISLYLNSQQKFYFFLGLVFVFTALTLKYFKRI
ncbi:MAG: MraY family glycosyltransferase [Candidatus Shapirobacteria bacterium]